MDTDKLNRLEIIDHVPCEKCYGTGRFDDHFCEDCNGLGSGGRQVIVGGPAYHQAADVKISLSFQDDGRTLKIFLEKRDV